MDEEKEVKKGRSIIGVKSAVVIAVVLIISALLYTYRSVFIAATVDGSVISRLAIIHELESKSGKAALDSIITEKLIGSEALKKQVTVSDDEINGVITNIEDQVKGQGSTLDEALKQQNMTLDDLKKQIVIQKELEKLLADKIAVSDDEVAKYITDNKVSIPAGQEDDYKSQIKSYLEQQKLSTESQTFIDSLKSQASIHYFVNY